MSNRTLDLIIRNAQLNLAVEDVSNNKGLFEYVYTNKVFESIHSRVSSIFNKRAAVTSFPALSNINQQVIDWANRESYLSLAEVTVNSPVGLKVSFLTYITALENALGYIVSVEDELIDPANKLISTYLNSPDLLKSKSTVKMNGKFADLAVERVTKDISACFNPDDKSAVVKYKVAFSRNADLEVIVERLSALQENLKAMSTKSVAKRVAVLFSNAEALADAIKDDPSYADVSKQVNAQLSSILYNCAQWVEFYGVFQYQVLTLSVAIGETADKLKKLSK